MNEYKTPTTSRRVAEAMLLGSEWARPLLAPPGTPPDRLKALREAYEKAVKEPELLAEAKKSRVEITPGKGAELQAKAKEAMDQPPEVLEQIKKLFVVQ